MRYIQICCFLLFSTVTATCYGQESVSRSRLMGIDLTQNSKRENRTAVLTMYIGRMDSFAIRNNIKVDKTASELLYTDIDLFFEKAKKTGWEVSGTAEADFYQIKKGINQFIVYVNYEYSPQQVNFVSHAPEKNIPPYATVALFIIRRR